MPYRGSLTSACCGPWDMPSACAMGLRLPDRLQMVYRNYSNLEVDFWVHRGKLGTTEPSLCLFHGSVSMGAPVLHALRELQDAGCPAQRLLTFTRASRRGALTSLRLRLVPGRDELRVMNIRRDSDAATIEMTDSGLVLLIHAVTSWLAGAEDFGVSPSHATLKKKDLGKLDQKSGELWFWGPGYGGP